jgi:uncharacterized membrane protein
VVLRRIYEVIGYLTFLLALVCLVSGFVGAVTGRGFEALVLGVIMAVFLGICGYITRVFAISGEVKGKSYVGIDEKSEIMRAESLVRKPQKVVVKS